MPQNSIRVYQPSNDQALSNSLMNIRIALHNAALSNVALAGDGFTDLEKISMVEIEELKLINGMDLAALLLRYEKVCKIRDQALWSNHPGGYVSFEDMARQQGIAISELSNIMDLCGIIFPYIESTLGIPIAMIWEQIGKSNFRELVPALKMIITGERSATRSTQVTVDQVMDNVAATARVAGQTLTPEAAQVQAVNNLLDAGQLPFRELRQQIRPDRTPSIEATMLQSNGRRFILAELSEDQFTLIQRRLNGYMDTSMVDLPRDLHTRQREGRRIPVLSTLLNEFEG